jgi:hypothetical protein
MASTLRLASRVRDEVREREREKEKESESKAESAQRRDSLRTLAFYLVRVFSTGICETVPPQFKATLVQAVSEQALGF